VNRRRWTALDVALIAVTLAGAYLLKRHYSRASVEELDWILRPTAALVSAVTGTPFVHEANAGYMSRDCYFVIAKPCAGVNFLIVALCASVLAFVRTRRTAAGKLLLVAATVPCAYAATLVTNTVRIALAVKLHTDVGAVGPLAPADLHRVEGVLIYTLLLCAFFAVARRALWVPR
jgi:exosortase K